MNLLMPKYRFKKVTDITPDDLRKMGAKAIGLDIDNTICYDGTSDFADGLENWLRTITEAGFPAVIITNAGRKRAAKVASALGIPFVARAKKPFTYKIKAAARNMGIDVADLAMLGDQLLSDVKGANRCGAIAVRIDPIRPEVRFKKHFESRRKKEAPVLKEFEKNHRYGVYDE